MVGIDESADGGSKMIVVLTGELEPFSGAAWANSKWIGDVNITTTLATLSQRGS